MKEKNPIPGIGGERYVPYAERSGEKAVVFFTRDLSEAGLDSGILDPTNRDLMGMIFATSALLGEDDFCMEYIEAYRDGIFGPKKD